MIYSGGFTYFFVFTPKLGEVIPIDSLICFQIGLLQPPTNDVLILHPLFGLTVNNKREFGVMNFAYKFPGENPKKDTTFVVAGDLSLGCFNEMFMNQPFQNVKLHEPPCVFFKNIFFEVKLVSSKKQQHDDETLLKRIPLPLLGRKI